MPSRLLFLRGCGIILAIALAGAAAGAQRERTRPGPRRSTTVSESQASELTLTLTEVAVRPVQVWVRTAGRIDDARRTVVAAVEGSDARRVKVGQRVRAFSPESRSRMHQATVSAVRPARNGVELEARLAGPAPDASRHFVLEIVTEEGAHLSVPNEAIIETGGAPVVYVRGADGAYARREIQAGLQGELYTQVTGGLQAGEQVVTIGSFFIDAQHRLAGP